VATVRPAQRSVDDYLLEIQKAIHKKYPDAEFRVVRRRRNEVTMDVIGDFNNAYDVSKLVADRTTDILVETGIFIVVVPVQRDGQ